MEDFKRFKADPDGAVAEQRYPPLQPDLEAMQMATGVSLCK